MSLENAVKNALLEAQEAFPEVLDITTGFDYSNKNLCSIYITADDEKHAPSPCTYSFITQICNISIIYFVGKELRDTVRDTCNAIAARVMTALQNNLTLDGFLRSGEIVSYTPGDDKINGDDAVIGLIQFQGKYFRSEHD